MRVRRQIPHSCECGYGSNWGEIVEDAFDFFASHYEAYGYPLLFAGVMLENAGIPVPGETAVLVAGFLASHLALGHGLGVIGDTVIGILGAVIGGFLAAVFHVGIAVVGHPIISAMIIAFIGAAVLLLIVRMFGGGARRRALS